MLRAVEHFLEQGDFETPQALAQRIDNTLLKVKPDEDAQHQIAAFCQASCAYPFRAVCIPPQYVLLAKQCVSGTSIKVATVIGFPTQTYLLAQAMQHPVIGDVPLANKLAEIATAKEDGVDELDIVMNVRAFRECGLVPELSQLMAAAGTVPVKLILETDLLTAPEIIAATKTCIQHGVAFVKTSTGMIQDGQGATHREAVRLIRHTIDVSEAVNKPGIKASGGLRTIDAVRNAFEDGADILGTGAGLTLVAQCKAD